MGNVEDQTWFEKAAASKAALTRTIEKAEAMYKASFLEATIIRNLTEKQARLFADRRFNAVMDGRNPYHVE